MAADYEHGLHCLRSVAWNILFLLWCGLTHVGLECCGIGHDLLSEARQPAYQKAFWDAGEYQNNKAAKWSSEDHICTMPICFHSNVIHNMHTKMQVFDDCHLKEVDLKSDGDLHQDEISPFSKLTKTALAMPSEINALPSKAMMELMMMESTKAHGNLAQLVLNLSFLLMLVMLLRSFASSCLEPSP